MKKLILSLSLAVLMASSLAIAWAAPGQVESKSANVRVNFTVDSAFFLWAARDTVNLSPAIPYPCDYTNAAWFRTGIYVKNNAAAIIKVELLGTLPNNIQLVLVPDPPDLIREYDPLTVDHVRWRRNDRMPDGSSYQPITGPQTILRFSDEENHFKATGSIITIDYYADARYLPAPYGPASVTVRWTIQPDV